MSVAILTTRGDDGDTRTLKGWSAHVEFLELAGVDDDIATESERSLAGRDDDFVSIHIGKCERCGSDAVLEDFDETMVHSGK